MRQVNYMGVHRGTPRETDLQEAELAYASRLPWVQDLLEEIIAEVRKGENGPEKQPARLLVYGCEISDSTFPELVESSGANIVIDDLGMGTRSYWEDVPVTADPLEGLAVGFEHIAQCFEGIALAIEGLVNDADAPKA